MHPSNSHSKSHNEMYVYKLTREERENHQAWKKCKWKSQVIEIAIWIFNTRNQKKKSLFVQWKKGPLFFIFFWIWMKNVKKNESNRDDDDVDEVATNDWLTDWLLWLLLLLWLVKKKKARWNVHVWKPFFSPPPSPPPTCHI